MQPYYLPYIGYFQLINEVDKFVIYDNIQYTKIGWINRNRFLQNGIDYLFTIPLRKGSDYLNINQRKLSDNSIDIRKKILRQINNNYRKARYFDSIFPIIENCLLLDETNLFEYVYSSILMIMKKLDIKTEVIISSTVNIDHNLKGQDKVIAICKEIGCIDYINSIGGQSLYNKGTFINSRINLKFIKTNEINYKQFDNKFVPWLSIIDVMMFNSKIEIQNMLKEYRIL